MELILTAAVAFFSTNLDDLFILVMFYGDRKIKEREIVTGQVLGIAALTGISLLGSFIGLIIDQAWIGLLGFVPVYIGIHGIIRMTKGLRKEEPETIVSTGKNILTVAGTTMANGGDNIGIYIPLFATMTWTGRLTASGIFILLTFLWCAIARYFTRHPFVAGAVDKYGYRVTPFVLILLGIYILWESKTLQLLSV